MALKEWHCQLFAVPDAIVEELPNLPLDRYGEGKFRRRGFSQHRLAATAGGGSSCCRASPFCQAKPFKRGLTRDCCAISSGCGWIPRPYGASAEKAPLDQTVDQQVDVRQVTHRGRRRDAGHLGRKASHQDGHTYELVGAEGGEAYEPHNVLHFNQNIPPVRTPATRKGTVP